MEDAVGDRSWVDYEHCQAFVDNILTAFGTMLPSKAISGEQQRKETQGTSIGKLVIL